MKGFLKLKSRLIVVLMLAFLFLTGCNMSKDRERLSKISYPLDFKTAVIKFSLQNDLDPYLVYGLILRESRFIHDAKSEKAAKGLMQLTDNTAEWTAEHIGKNDFKKDDIFDPATNIELGCAYFSYLLERYDYNVRTALCAYNAGMGKVDEWLKNSSYSKNGKNIDEIPYPETKKYVEDIENYSKKYKEIYPDLVNF